ncbi:glycosyltransferase [Microbacterium xylanilyticum]
MPSLISRTAGWLVRHRSALPRWATALIEAPARNPDGLAARLALRVLGGGPAPHTDVPTTPIRVLIAPTNYSGQAYRWARALEAADPAIGARNRAEQMPGGFDFPADVLVPYAASQSSRSWADDEYEAVRGFTHVLMEAERPLFGKKFDRDPAAELAALARDGISTAYLCHGTDIRDPDHHAARTPWSMYPEDPRTAVLRDDARANLDLLTRHRRPTFVSTPDLLADVPWATWCPVVVDTATFRPGPEPFRGETVTVMHASSNAVQKGSHWIEPALRPLIEDGRIAYRLLTATPAAEMPAAFRAVDIVIDQFRVGSYGVAACEAMASGRVVVGHVLPEVRAHVEDATGLDLPIVDATPDTLLDVVSALLRDPERARRIAAEGPAFVEAVHSGPASARVLIENWIERA